MAARRKRSARHSPFELTVMIFGVIAFMYFTGEVLRPLAVSVLLSFALAPAVRLFERVGLPKVGAVILTVLVALGLLVGIGFVVGEQLTSLTRRLPSYQKNIEKKLDGLFQPAQQSAKDRLNDLVNQVTAKLEKPRARERGGLAPIQRVEVVQEPSFQERVRSTSGPYLEFLGVSSLVMVLVLFLLMSRKDLSDRIIGLFGQRHVSLTTRTMEEIGHRISRYLGTFALVNSCFGLVIGLGLGLIGLPFAVLWGCLAAMLRFIPFVGVAVAFVLPLVFSFAHFPGWTQLVEVAALFGTVEVALNSFIEPVIYGKTTGISALSLLVAAMFWTWLWGTIGLLVSTPLTVCLAVLGKYVPSLRFFATLLGEEAELQPNVRFYQRLVGLDRDGALEVVDAVLKQQPHVEVFDQVLVPALSRAERDAARDELDEVEQEFVWQVISDLLDRLEGVETFDLASGAARHTARGKPETGDEASATPRVLLMGLAVYGPADALALRMLGQLLAPSGFDLEIVTETESPLNVAQRVADRSPKLVILSHLPPERLTAALYLVRRVRAQLAELPIVLGRWGATGSAASAAKRSVENGASHVAFTLADARDRVLSLTMPDTKPEAAALPLPV
jgi:predicted PurR-regulated permease PerM